VSILGAIVRVHPRDRPDVARRLREMPGVELALDPGDGRLVLVIEDIEIDRVIHEAATALQHIAHWPAVLSTSLVYEYSGPDIAAAPVAVEDYSAWRGALSSAPAPLRPPMPST
jgi:nitrate reductase NapD